MWRRKEAKQDDIIVTELSSFQLMGIKTFKPKIAILTNLYDAHLDYHGTFNNYAEAKFGVTRNQDDSDYFIYNADQPIVVGYAAQSHAQKIPFSSKGRTENGISADETTIYWQGEPYMDRANIALPGKHNLENILAAVAACILVGCDKEKMEEVLATFGS